jgi:hypothetical protein
MPLRLVCGVGEKDVDGRGEPGEPGHDEESGIRPVYPDFPGEEFSPRRAWAGNKTTVIRG